MTRKRPVLLFVVGLLAVALAQDSQHNKANPINEEIQIPPGKENLPAEQVFHNIEILKGKPASRLPGMMKSLNRLLGVQCTYCHVAGAWEKEEPEPKRTARHMFKMVYNISEKYFDGRDEVACWTCRRGNPKPPNDATEISARLATLPKERQQLVDSINPGPDKDSPSEQAFQNIRVLTDMPAGRMARTMGVFTVVLGVDCSHSHLADQWDDDDKPAKQTTREMVQMVSGINQQLLETQDKVTCWTCHRGALKPEATPASTK
jgi:photosynthetic reaction center cytochrome c subunit